VLLKPGLRLKSAVCDGAFLVVHAPESDVALTCGGHSVVAPGDDLPLLASLTPEGDGTQLGKRYVDELTRLELLCVKASKGSLQVDGRALELQGSKALPSSD
jgi:hypothetical protein